MLYMKKNQIIIGLPDLEEELSIYVAFQYGKQRVLHFPKESTLNAAQK